VFDFALLQEQIKAINHVNDEIAFAVINKIKLINDNYENMNIKC